MNTEGSVNKKGKEESETVLTPSEIFLLQNRSETDTQFAAQRISDAHERMIRRRILGAHRQRNVININLRTR